MDYKLTAFQQGPFTWTKTKAVIRWAVRNGLSLRIEEIRYKPQDMRMGTYYLVKAL